MANNVENLEFLEISDIPVTEDKSGIYAISVDANGEAKAYPLDNFKTGDEVDSAMKDKAPLKDFKTAQTDINSLKSTKAERVELSPIRSDIQELQNNKLDKNALDNFQVAVKRYKDPVSNITNLPKKEAVDGEGNPINEEGDGRVVTNDKDVNGNSYIWVWDGNAWSRTAFTTFPSDVATKTDILYTSIFPYKAGQIGVHIPILSEAIKELYIYPEFMLDGYSYRIGSLIRTEELSQITLYSVAPETNGLTNVERFEFAGNADNGTAQLYKGLRFSIVIDWGVIPMGSSFTNMVNGYELDSLCFSKANPLNSVISSKNWNYPYNVSASGRYVDTLKIAVKNIFIHPHIIESGKKYYLTSVRRNHLNTTTEIKETQIAIYSKRESDGATSMIDEVRIEGDMADGNVQIIEGSVFIIAINWDAINDGAGFTSMFDGYELDKGCFSLQNELYVSRSTKEIKESFALPTIANLPHNGYIDKRNGGLSSSPNLKASGYEKVTPGQKIRYIGQLYGNAAICGYPSMSTDGFVVLHDPAIYGTGLTTPRNAIVEIEIPEGINYIRYSKYGDVDCMLEWLSPPSQAYNSTFDDLKTKSITTTGGQLEANTYKINTQKITTRWIELTDNYDLPSKGFFIGMRGSEVVVSINGVIKKVNLIDL